jgi:hypothetical protein
MTFSLSAMATPSEQVSYDPLHVHHVGLGVFCQRAYADGKIVGVDGP